MYVSEKRVPRTHKHKVIPGLMIEGIARDVEIKNAKVNPEKIKRNGPRERLKSFVREDGNIDRAIELLIKEFPVYKGQEKILMSWLAEDGMMKMEVNDARGDDDDSR